MKRVPKSGSVIAGTDGGAGSAMAREPSGRADSCAFRAGRSAAHSVARVDGRPDGAGGLTVLTRVLERAA